MLKIHQGSGFEQVFRHPVFHGGPGVLKIGIGAQHHRFRVQSLGSHPFQHFQPVHARHADIRNDDIRFRFTDQFQPVVAVFRHGDNLVIAVQLLQQLFNSFPDPDLVLNDGNFHRIVILSVR